MPRRPSQPEPVEDTRLAVPRQQAREEIAAEIEKLLQIRQKTISSESDLDAAGNEMRVRVDYIEELLRRRFTPSTVAEEFRKATGPIVMAMNLREQYGNFLSWLDARVTALRSIDERLEFYPEPGEQEGSSTAAHGDAQRDTIFLVHGRDVAAREHVARFVERLTGLRVLILHEVPSFGMTLIEKLEHYEPSAVAAIVLLTGDDEGRLKSAADPAPDLQPRSRQNVVFELGYFMAALGRKKVMVLHEDTVEPPSDMAGIVYVSLDEAGAWKNEIARELAAAKIDVNFERAFGAS